jgi:hypothetical protein
MSLQLPSYPDPTSTTPAADAYVWITSLSIDFGSGTGVVTVAVNRDAASAAALLPPLARVAVGLGSTPATSPYQLQSLTADMADPTFAAAFATIRETLYTQLMTLAPFAGATEVP